MPDYSKTVIYKIVCKDTNVKEIYVGHTTEFVKRKSSHKRCCNNKNSKKNNIKVYKIIRENGGFENFDMIEVEKYPCDNLKDAITREGYWYKILKGTLNSCVPGRSRDDYKVLYLANNKDKIKETTRVYYENNQDKIKEYTAKNKVKINERHRIYHAKHKDKAKKRRVIYRSNNIVALKFKKNAYYKNNADKINKQKQEYRKQNIDAIKEKTHRRYDCACGVNCVWVSKARHERSKFHQDYIAQLPITIV